MGLTWSACKSRTNECLLILGSPGVLHRYPTILCDNIFIYACKSQPGLSPAHWAQLAGHSPARPTTGLGAAPRTLNSPANCMTKAFKETCLQKHMENGNSQGANSPANLTMGAPPTVQNASYIVYSPVLHSRQLRVYQLRLTIVLR